MANEIAAGLALEHELQRSAAAVAAARSLKHHLREEAGTACTICLSELVSSMREWATFAMASLMITGAGMIDSVTVRWSTVTQAGSLSEPARETNSLNLKWRNSPALSPVLSIMGVCFCQTIANGRAEPVYRYPHCAAACGVRLCYVCHDHPDYAGVRNACPQCAIPNPGGLMLMV
jgi:hypothetical protein